MSSSLVSVDLVAVKNTCFVVMPFHALFETEYQRVLKPAIEGTGLECVRGDEIYSRAAIINDIWQSLRQSRVVVAELSGQNPNVMYEIGLAHAIGKPVIVLTRNQEDVPFDLKGLRYLFHDTNNPEWGENLRAELAKKIRGVLETPALADHLPGIEVAAELPPAPARPAVPQASRQAAPDLAGAWSATWLSVRR